MAEKPKEQVEMAPDPEEDDLDDLDDVLDQFASKPSSKSTAVDTSKTAPSTSSPTRPSGQETPKHIPGHLPSDADLQAQLQSGMKDLMGELDGNPQMQAEFEKMMQELIQAGQADSDAEMAEHIGKATAAVAGSDSAIGAAAAGPGEAREGKKEEVGKSAKGNGGGAQQENFQDTIRKTMERMQASSSSATEASHSNPALSSEEDMLAQMMKELGASGGMGEGEEDFNTMLMSMMAQLTNREILYEPMKELHDKFPDWMSKNANAGSVGKDDLERYKDQQTLVGEIVGRFERKGYSDDNEADRDFIVERMQKMQAAGSPPPDLVGDMSAAQEALGDLEGGCPTQ